MSVKYYSILVLLFVGFAGCATEQIKLDLDTYNKNPQAYKGKEVIITTTLKDVVENNARYRGKVVELSAPLTYYGYVSYWTWYVLLEKDGKKLRCYEYHYRLDLDQLAVDLALQARVSHKEVTVRGTVEKAGIELDRLIYDGYNINTNYHINNVYPYWLRY